MNETIESLRRVIIALKDREQGYHETIERLSGDNVNHVASLARLKMRTDRLHREMVDMKRDMREVQTAVLDVVNHPHIHTIMRKGKFEPLFTKQDSEVV